MADTVIYPYEGRERDLNDIRNGTHWIVWFKNDVDISVPEDVEFTDLTTATFPGYSNQMVTFGSITRNADDNAQMTSTTATVTRSSGAGSETIYGWAWCEYNGSLLRIRRLVKYQTPLVIDVVGEFMSAVVTVDQGECPP